MLASGRPLPSGSALIITAHPDDECMFFLPTIVSLVADGTPVHLLCLSTGDADGLGAVRRQELSHACSLLGVKDIDTMVIDDAGLPDGLTNRWPPEAVAVHVVAAIAAFEPASVRWSVPLRCRTWSQAGAQFARGPFVGTCS